MFVIPLVVASDPSCVGMTSKSVTVLQSLLLL
jgi:hypothetical protein